MMMEDRDTPYAEDVAQENTKEEDLVPDADKEIAPEEATPFKQNDIKQVETPMAIVDKSAKSKNRRKSRDETSIAGRNSKKPLHSTNNRNQSKPSNFRSGVAGTKLPTSTQNSLAIYTQANMNGINSKNLTAQ